MRRYSEARSKPQTHGEALVSLDKLVAPLIKKGQPLTHIYAAMLHTESRFPSQNERYIAILMPVCSVLVIWIFAGK